MQRNVHKIRNMKMGTQRLNERKANFERMQQKMEEEGYQSRKVCIGIIKANVVAIFIGIVATILMVGMYMAVQDGIEFHFNIDDPLTPFLYFICADLILLVVHEALHGLTWGFFCKRKWKSIQFGVMWKYLTPYCSCLEPLHWKVYLLGGLMPFLVLGIGFFVVAIMEASVVLLFFAILNVIGAGGDLMVVWKIIRNHEGILMDLPEECGYMQFYK